MPLIVCHVSVDTGPEQHLLDLSSNWWRLKQKDVDTDLLLVSGEYRVRVHQAVLLPLSTFLQELVPVSCPCSTPAIILPPMQGHTLSALVEIIYTGRSHVVSQSVKEEFKELIANLQLMVKVTPEKIVSLVPEDDQKEIEMVSEKTMFTSYREKLILQMVQHSVPPKARLPQRLSLPIVSNERGYTSLGKMMKLMKNNSTPTRKFNEPREAKSAALAITTGGNKRKIESISDHENDMFPEHKKIKLDLRLQHSENVNLFIKVQDEIVDDLNYREGEKSTKKESLVKLKIDSENILMRIKKVKNEADFPSNKVHSRNARRVSGRCQKCPNCKMVNCGECHFCLNMKQFGGSGSLKKACMSRLACLEPNKKSYTFAKRQKAVVKVKQIEDDSIPSVEEVQGGVFVGELLAAKMEN